MKYFFTLLLIAIAPVKALADGKLIEAPVAPSFDIKDLEQRSEKSKEVKSGWSEYQAKMDEAFEKTVSFMAVESEVDIAIAAGERFLQAFGGNNNPYSTEDDEQIAELNRLLEARYRQSEIDQVPQPESSNPTEDSDARRSSDNRINELDGEDWRLIADAVTLSFAMNCPFTVESCHASLGHSILPERPDVPKPFKLGDDLRLQPALMFSEGVWTITRVNDAGSFRQPYSGVARAFNSLGVLLWELTYLEGQLDGPAIRTHPTGQKASQVNFKEGRLNGKREDWYEDGSLRRSLTYENGYPVKAFSEWDERGQLRTLARYKSPNRALLRGNVQAPQSPVQLSLLHGTAKTWHPNGQLAFKGLFGDGNVLATHRFYYPNGGLKLEYKLIPGAFPSANMPVKKMSSRWDIEGNLIWKSKKHFFQLWDENQNLVVDFSNRKKRNFYNSGVLKSEVSYNRFYSAFEGKFAYFYENGKTMLSGQYSKSERVGHWKKFDPNGALIKQVCFADKPPERRVVCS